MHAISQRSKFWGRPQVWIGVMVLAGFMTASAARAQVTNIIWKASLTGQLGIQQFDTKMNPYVRTASFNTINFLTMVLGGTPPTNSVLALNYEAFNGQTNYFLSVFDTVGLTNTLRISTGEAATILRYTTGFLFTESMALPPVSPTWGGGLFQLSGHTATSHSTPTTVSATIQGFVTDTRPTDLNGTTGILTRATIQTIGNPLRVQPPVVH
jgi:hypothetical protein